MYPDAQILPLDYDPDVSFANIENRLQMLIMNVKEKEEVRKEKSRGDGTGTGFLPDADFHVSKDTP